MYIYLCVYIYIYTHKCVYVYIYIYTHTHTQYFFIHSSVDGHLVCFHILTIVNNAAMSIDLCISFWISASCLSEWLWSKRIQITNVGKDVEKREPSHTVGGNVNWCSHCGNSMEVSEKTKNRTTIWPRISTPGNIHLCPKKKTLIWKKSAPQYSKQHYLQLPRCGSNLSVHQQMSG